jgi:hypothetical protein
MPPRAAFRDELATPLDAAFQPPRIGATRALVNPVARGSDRESE